MQEKDITFKPTHKLILTTGHLPRMAKTESRRMIVEGFALEHRLIDRDFIKNLTDNN